MGVRFEPDAVAIVYDHDRQTLLERPRYTVEQAGPQFRIRIQYDLPQRPGGARVAGAFGAIVLEAAPGGRLRAASHNLIDARTGSARMRIAGDPAFAALSLTRCRRATDAGGIEELRGRSAL